MKRIVLLVILTLFCTLSYSQVPNAFNYQAVVRDASGEIIANQDVAFRVSILQGSESGSAIYSETHLITTNGFGLTNLKIGTGENQTGIFSPGGWGVSSHFIKIEIDVNGGEGFVHMGASQLLSVPYAFHAQTVEEDQVDDADADPVNELQTWGTLPDIPADILDGDDVNDADTDPTNELQDISVSGHGLTISGGSTVTLPDEMDDADADPTNELQILSISNDTIYLTDGGYIKLPAGFDGQYNSLTGVPENISEFTNDAGYITSPDDADNDPTNEIQQLSLLGDVLSISGGTAVILPDEVDDADADPTNELQSLTISGTLLSLSDGGGTVTIPSAGGGGDNWGTQLVQSDETLIGDGSPGNPLGVDHDELLPEWGNIQNKPSTIYNDNDSTNELQTISLSGSQLTLSDNGGTVSLPASGGGTADNWGTQVVESDNTLTGDGTTAGPLGVDNSEVEPDWANIQNIPAGFADNTDDVGDADETNELQELSISGTVLTLSDGGGSVTLPSSGGGGDNWGTQVVVTDTTLSGDGSTANPLGAVQGKLTPDWSKIQNIPTGFMDNTDNVDDSDADPANELQDISLSGNDLTISGGSTITLPSSATGGDDWGTQVVQTDLTLKGDGTSGNLLKVDHEELLPEWGNINNIPAGFADDTDDVDDDDADETNELQTLSLSGSDLTLSDGGGTVTLPSGGSSLWTESGSDVYRSSGKVGIGTSTPEKLLHIYGGRQLIEGTASITPSISFKRESTTQKIYLNTNGAMVFEKDGSPANKVVINNNGRVGISTNQPTKKLDVDKGNVRIRGESSFTSNGNEAVLYLGDNNHYIKGIYGYGIRMGVNNTFDILNIDENTGNVGILTMYPAPAYALDVNGHIRTRGSVYYGGTVGFSDGTAYIKPDFVFEEEYATLATEEVEKFLQEENHLPWVTSAKQEKKENGESIDITRMAFETLEAVENLQLQIIQLKKENKILKDQLGQIQIQLNRIISN